MKNLLKLAAAFALTCTFVAAHAQQGDDKMMKKDAKADGKMMKHDGKMMHDKGMKKEGKMMKDSDKKMAKDAKMDKM
ncbi:hypothetical protein [Hymenobacter daeguensis]